MRLEVRQTQQANWRHLAGTGRLYAIVDSNGNKTVRPRAAECGPGRAVSLFQGTYEAQYERAAPFFFQADEATFDWIASGLWNTSWGIFIWADVGFDAVRRHLHQFLRVRGADGSQYLMRFWDPNILAAFLKSSNDGELAQFFGPVTAFGGNETLYRLRPRE